LHRFQFPEAPDAGCSMAGHTKAQVLTTRSELSWMLSCQAWRSCYKRQPRFRQRANWPAMQPQRFRGAMHGSQSNLRQCGELGITINSRHPLCGEVSKEEGGKFGAEAYIGLSTSPHVEGGTDAFF
jgi:hypothetical protein